MPSLVNSPDAMTWGYEPGNEYATGGANCTGSGTTRCWADEHGGHGTTNRSTTENKRQHVLTNHLVRRWTVLRRSLPVNKKNGSENSLRRIGDVQIACLRLRLGVRVRRSGWLLVVLLIFVNRILSFGTLQLDGDHHRWLAYIVVFPVGLESRGQHLNAQLAVGDAVKTGFAFRVGLELKPAAILLAVFIDRMQHDARVAYRFSVVVLEHHKAQCGHRIIVL